MDVEPTSSTPPRQTDTDATAAGRRLSDEQKSRLENEPIPPDPNCRDDLPDPVDVGEAG